MLQLKHISQQSKPASLHASLQGEQQEVFRVDNIKDGKPKIQIKNKIDITIINNIPRKIFID